MQKRIFLCYNAQTSVLQSAAPQSLEGKVLGLEWCNVRNFTRRLSVSVSSSSPVNSVKLQ